MARLYQGDNDEFRFETDGIDFELNENNMFVNLHRDVPYMDRVGIEDPRDNEWWTWFRASQPEEVFNEMVQIAYTVGTILLRSTALTEVEAQFDKRHGVTDDEIEGLLGEPRE